MDWHAFFRTVRGELNAFAIKHWPLPNDRSGTERVLSRRRLFDLFPVAVDVLTFDTEGVDVKFQEGRYATAIRYDLAKPKKLSVNDHGIVMLRDFDASAQFIRSALAVDDAILADLRSLSFSWMTDYPEILQIVRYDVRTRLADYIRDLTDLLCMSSLADLFVLQYDFNAKYRLKQDAILAESELLLMNDANQYFFRGERIDMIRKAQEDVARVQFIPQVPGEVRRVIHAAKRLYVFGLFEYEFFTISQHYAYLAVEAALYHRWSALQTKPFILTHESEQLTIHDSGRGTIARICEHKNWNRRTLRVNGQRFPFTSKSLLARLRKAGAITEHQHRDLEYWLKQRNSHSHREFGPLEMPDPGVIHDAAEIINALFDVGS